MRGYRAAERALVRRHHLFEWNRAKGEIPVWQVRLSLI